MESLKIIDIEKFTESGECWISIKIHDKKENIYFWIDCSLIDGFGNHKNFKTGRKVKNEKLFYRKIRDILY